MSKLIKIPGVMTREMIKDYDGEKVYASAAELRKATEKKDMLPICMYKGPKQHATKIMAEDMADEEIIGWGLIWYEDTKVKTNLLFDPLKMTDAQLVMLANLEKYNLSPAFRSIPIMEKGAFQGQPYDSKQTDIEWGHIAVVEHGRCSDLHGCGLYKDHFDGLEVPTRDKITRCVELLLSKGHQPEAAEEICLSAYKDTTGEGSETGRYLVENYTGSGNSSDHSDYKREDQMPSCVEEKVAGGMSKEEAEKACAEKTDAAELAKVVAQRDAAEKELAEIKHQSLVEQVHAKLGYPKDQLEQKDNVVLDALLSFELPPGQPITGERKDAKPPAGSQDVEDADEDEDPDYKPGLSKLVKAKYVKDADGNTTTSGEPVRVLLDLETGKTERVS